MPSDFLDYDLPPHLIAQEPAAERDRARLLVVRRGAAALEHRTFGDLPDLLSPGDLLILNDTRVVPARLVGRRLATGGRWEGLFLREVEGGAWEMKTKTRGYLRPGEEVVVEPGGLVLTAVGRNERDRHWLLRPRAGGTPFELLARYGRVPLPRYIRKGDDTPADMERYQTVYAAKTGAIAAPTAGLHFTPAVFERLAAKGVDRSFVTLHVGEGTFAPIETENVAEHRMHMEWGELPEATATAIAACRQRGGRVVAVGTTSVRVLETSGGLSPWRGETGLFIRPPYAFRAVDALITNFHLPRTSLLCLVSAFAGVELTRRVYEAAVAESYRFYSYGDAMLIL